jgi:tetratricopeptide (TPR) repeat protein
MPKLAEPGIAVAMLGLLVGCLVPVSALGQGEPGRKMSGGREPIIRECTLSGQSSDKASIGPVFLSRADAYVRKTDYDRALADYDEVIKLAPDTAIAFALRGVVHAKRGDYDGAIADYERAIDLEPNLASAFSNHGLAWAAKGELRLAIADYTKAIKLDPKLPTIAGSRTPQEASSVLRSQITPKRSCSIRITPTLTTTAAILTPLDASTTAPRCRDGVWPAAWPDNCLQR